MKHTDNSYAQKSTSEDLGHLLAAVNTSIEKQIEQMKEDVNGFTDFLIQLKLENQQKHYSSRE